jgi:hypothetical protein
VGTVPVEVGVPPLVGGLPAVVLVVDVAPVVCVVEVVVVVVGCDPGFGFFGCAASYAACCARWVAASSVARSEFNIEVSCAPWGTRHDVCCAIALEFATTHCGGFVAGGGGTTRSVRNAAAMISENTGADARPPYTSFGLLSTTIAATRGASAGANPTNDAMCWLDE